MFDALAGDEGSLTDVEVEEDGVLTFCNQRSFWRECALTLEFLLHFLHSDGECWIE